jgi:hypothetical protein
MLLTFEIVRAARPPERRYVLGDGQGLSLHVMPCGSKWWRFRYHFRRTETNRHAASHHPLGLPSPEESQDPPVPPDGNSFSRPVRLTD